MKSMKISLSMMFMVGLICCVVASLSAMKQTSQKFTIKSTRAAQSTQPVRYRSEEVWVKTSDNAMVSLPQWYIDQMKVLQVLFLQQKGQNSKDNPVDASMISYENLMLMQKVLNIAGNLEEFALFCENLTPEQKVNLTNAAFTLEATGLAALLTNITFSSEIQEKLGSSIVTAGSLLDPVVKYLHDQNFSKTILMGKKDNAWPSCAAFSPYGDYMVSGGGSSSYSRILILWNGKTGEKIKSLEGHNGKVACVAFSPDGKYIVSGSEGDKNLIMWNLSNPHNITHKVLEGHNDKVACVAFSPNGMQIISGGRDKRNLILWDISNPDKITEQELIGHSFVDLNFNIVKSVAFSPDGNYIVSGSNGYKNNLILWDAKTGKKIEVLEGHGDDVNCVVFSPDGNYIISGSGGGSSKLILWDGKTGEKIKVLAGHGGDVYCVAFSPDSKYIVSGSEGMQNNLFLWDISPIMIKNKLPHLLFSLKNYQSGLLPNDIVQLIGKNLMELSQLNITSQELKGHGRDSSGWSGTLCVAFSPDGKSIVSGGWGKQNLIIWETRTGKKIKVEDVNGPVKCVAFSPDGSSIVYGGGYGGNDLILFKLVDPQALNFIATQLDIAQARFLYRLYLGKINNVPVVLDKSDPDYQIFKTLPSNVQQLIKSFLPFEEASMFIKKTKKEKIAFSEKSVQEKINHYKSLFNKTGATFDEKIKTIKTVMQGLDKNSADYKACERLLLELEQEAAFEA